MNSWGRARERRLPALPQTPSQPYKRPGAGRVYDPACPRPLNKLSIGPNLSSSLALSQKLPHCRQQFPGNLHGGFLGILKRGFIFCHRFFLRLVLIMSQNPTNPFFVPSWWKLAFFHFIDNQEGWWGGRPARHFGAQSAPYTLRPAPSRLFG
jgi:hypothetical protein